ncbi:auxin-responsive protein SAUR50 [Populus alba x Populus x berolinensis]|nr:auxin-responsive protein SAUR50 [Populus alba x Populus x berolinensis]
MARLIQKDDKGKYCKGKSCCFYHQRYSFRAYTQANMKNTKRNLLVASLNRWRKMGSRVMPCCAYQWGLWPSMHEGKSIPRDVPKGHLVVYIGENNKRFVIKITLLKHPLFKALLDQAQDEYDFTGDSKLCIPCDESIFLDVVRCAGSPLDRKSCFSL